MMDFRYSTENLVEDKIDAIREVYRKWGVILRSALKSTAPHDLGTLRKSLRFKVLSPKRKADITGTVRLLVGVLDQNSPVLKYLHTIVYGDKLPHFVPASEGSALFGWALRHGLLYYGTSRKKDGSFSTKSRQTWRVKSTGAIFRGLRIYHQPNDFFGRVYARYHSQVKQDIRRILQGG